MAQFLGRLWERVQGKPHLRKICDTVFDQRQNDMGLLGLTDLHYSVLLAYNLFNKHFGGRHKEPPSADVVASIVKQLKAEKPGGIDREQFYGMILEWTSKDRRLFVQNKFLLAIMAAPAMAELTKRGGERVPSIGNVIQKIPTPVFVPLYIVGLILIQDFSIHAD
ncbi:hypothetical protein MRB53_003597 [Persea americana]|uniref:Uncharacterized protein n=1 Tax=Persea americana TaxID=3435 RepID=A0ACC2MY31_PERAE|nr:hypothetical protein MRB53_003597 [Persea americana]